MLVLGLKDGEARVQTKSDETPLYEQDCGKIDVPLINI